VTSGLIRLPAHDLRDETLEYRDAVLAFAAAEQPGAMHILGCEVGQRTGSAAGFAGEVGIPRVASGPTSDREAFGIGGPAVRRVCAI
jgi:hypothetical protein